MQTANEQLKQFEHKFSKASASICQRAIADINHTLELLGADWHDQAYIAKLFRERDVLLTRMSHFEGKRICSHCGGKGRVDK